MAPSAAAIATMGRIIGCPLVDVAANDRRHPCAGVVKAQPDRRARLHPEPWSGDLERARLLFVGSNPGRGDDVYPTRELTLDHRAAFFANRLSPRRRSTASA